MIRFHLIRQEQVSHCDVEARCKSVYFAVPEVEALLKEAHPGGYGSSWIFVGIEVLQQEKGEQGRRPTGPDENSYPGDPEWPGGQPMTRPAPESDVEQAKAKSVRLETQLRATLDELDRLRFDLERLSKSERWATELAEKLRRRDEQLQRAKDLLADAEDELSALKSELGRLRGLIVGLVPPPAPDQARLVMRALIAEAGVIRQEKPR